MSIAARLILYGKFNEASGLVPPSLIQLTAMCKTASLLLCLLCLPVSSSKIHEYEYVEDTSRGIGVERGEVLLEGRLDAAGNFTQNPGALVLKKGMPRTGGILEIINLRRPGREHVYEFRSGRLIKGELDKDGNFIPDLGSKVIDFKDYHYKKDLLYIYNLPGYFKEKKGEPK